MVKNVQHISLACQRQDCRTGFGAATCKGLLTSTAIGDSIVAAMSLAASNAPVYPAEAVHP